MRRTRLTVAITVNDETYGQYLDPEKITEILNHHFSTINVFDCKYLRENMSARQIEACVPGGWDTYRMIH